MLLGAVDTQVFWEILAQLPRRRSAIDLDNQPFTSDNLSTIFGEIFERALAPCARRDPEPVRLRPVAQSRFHESSPSPDAGPLLSFPFRSDSPWSRLSRNSCQQYCPTVF